MPLFDTLTTTTPPESICIIRLSAIGDCCHTLPVVRTLQAAYPETAITWIIGTTEHRLLEGADGIEFITFDKSKGLKSWFDVCRKLKNRHFPLLLDMHASMRANFVSMAVNARRRIGFDRARARDYQWLFTTERIPALQQQHVMDGLFGFTSYLGIKERIERWDIPVDAADREYASRLRIGERPLCIISPCSSQRANNYRNWPIDNYVQLIRHLQKHYDAQIVLTGAPTKIEQKYAEGILAKTGNTVSNLVGQTSLKRLLALLEIADLVICPDSGPAHMANAVGTPVIGLYATSNPARTGPYASRSLTVNRYPDAVAAEFGKPIQELRWGQRVRDPAAMDLITVADVTEKVAQALGS